MTRPPLGRPGARNFRGGTRRDFLEPATASDPRPPERNRCNEASNQGGLLATYDNLMPVFVAAFVDEEDAADFRFD